MHNRKLKWNIFAYLVIFCFILLFILWLFQTVFLGEMYKSVRQKEIRDAMILVEKNIESENLRDILIELDFEKNIKVFEGKYINNQNIDILPYTNKFDPKLIDRPHTLVESKEFLLSNGKTIYLTFSAIITPINATVSTLKMQLYIISIIMILASIILALALSNKISKPIAKLNEGAKKLSKGDYSPIFNGKGFVEIKELSDTLNSTAIELSKVDDLRKELIANISHDLRTPLSLIYSYAEMMNDFPTEITNDQIKVIMDESKRLSSLVNDILDVSKLENGSMKLNIENYNLTKSIKNTVYRVSKLIENNGYNIVFESYEDIYIDADKVKTTQAFYNLLTNAINYSGEDKIIVVKQTRIDNKVRIEVIDNGEGIENESIKYIWDRYYKIDKKHKRSIMGTGLGLSIVKKIFDLHKIEYGVYSEIDKGSNFWFEFEIK